MATNIYIIMGVMYILVYKPRGLINEKVPILGI